MKISEVLSEAPPGTSKLAAFRGRVEKGAANLVTKLRGPEKQRIAKQNQKKWYAAVKRKQKKNIDMTNERTYRDELYKYLGSNGKLKLSRSLKRMVNQLPLNDQNILKIMLQTIDDRIAAKEKLANAPKVGQNTPPTPAPGPTP